MFSNHYRCSLFPLPTRIIKQTRNRWWNGASDVDGIDDHALFSGFSVKNCVVRDNQKEKRPWTQRNKKTTRRRNLLLCLSDMRRYYWKYINECVYTYDIIQERNVSATLLYLLFLYRSFCTVFLLWTHSECYKYTYRCRMYVCIIVGAQQHNNLSLSYAHTHTNIY